MKVSLDWLKEFLTIDIEPEKLSDVLTLAGLEVEGMDRVGGDVIFDVALTPNLGHCMSVSGIAHELAALLGCPVRIPTIELSENGAPIEKLVKVEVQDARHCPRYGARVVEGIKVGPSPEWLKERLEKSGMRSVNNVVDATHFVMLGLGQPMHAFDLDRLAGGKIVVTSTKPFEKLVTLDGQERDLPKDALLICDAKGPVAIAGVMGGEASAVTESTTRILLEAAYFDEAMVRRVSKWLGLRTDSSMRFEKGIDPNTVPLALDRAAAVIQRICGGKIAQGRIDSAARTFERRELFVRRGRVNEMLGTHLCLSEIKTLLERLNIQIAKEEDETLFVKVPTYRNDLQWEIDLIEEIARIYGYNNIPMRPERYPSAAIPHSGMYLFEKETRTLLLQEGLQEWMTCDLVSPEMAALCEEDKKRLIAVLKAASVDQSVLRTSLLPSMLLSLKSNLDHQNDAILAFEVGRIHFKEKEAFVEESSAALLLMGQTTPRHFDPKPRSVDFFDCKGIVENVLDALGIDAPTFERSHSPHFHPKRQARIHAQGMVAGIVGELHPALLKRCAIDKECYFATLNLSALIELKRRAPFFRGLSIFPASERDWTLTVSETTGAQEILDAIKAMPSPYLEKITVLDLYKSEQIGKDRKNLTFRFLYRDPGKTIAMETVEREHAKLTEGVLRKINV